MKPILFICMMFCLTACEYHECKNTNPVFDRYAPTDQPYKAEVINQLRNPLNQPITYSINGYMVKDSCEYILVHCVGRQLCADAMMLIKDWGNLADVKRTKSMGYYGAGLDGLKYTIIDTAKVLLYEDVAEIVD